MALVEFELAEIESLSLGTESEPYGLSIEQVGVRYGCDLERGLEESQVRMLQARHGPNRLAETPPEARWRRFLRQFRELVILILIGAAIISGALGEWLDGSAILAIVLLNGILGFLQEEKAERALASLRKLSAPLAKVIREGVLRTIPASELVPGDRIELEAGDQFPADARLIRTFGFRAQEAALTGESVPVAKEAKAVVGPQTALADRRNMVYLGTIAVAGKASAIVAATGMKTELGRIAGMLARQESGPTPLQRRLAELGRVLVWLCLGAVAVIFLLQSLRGGELFEVFLLSVSLAVAAVPEGLPAVVTIALALGLQRMVARHALIRKLPSVETLGSVTVICSDKTGTLTRNEMTVRGFHVGERRFCIAGCGYEPQGKFYVCPEIPSDWREQPARSETKEFGQERCFLFEDPGEHPDLLQALTIGALCNNARLVSDSRGSPGWQVIGDPTEGALLSVAQKAGVVPPDLPGRLLHEIPFDSDRKAMSVVIRDEEGDAATMYTKGALEAVLPRCVSEQRSGRIVPLTEQRRAAIGEACTEMASRALRVLALAYRPVPRPDEGSFEETRLVFAGLVGMIDPPREEAKQAVQQCHEAGIRSVMITGDHPATARAIARELGMLGPEDEAVTGQELDGMSDTDLAGRVRRIAVYARVSAEHKFRVVNAWKSHGDVVAMTGDGVNDAPAVKAADIGIAMGLSGTDVTKEASDMVLTDDNFASIVSAVEEGRCIYDNIQKVLAYLLSCNAGEILLMLLASLAGLPAPLFPLQLLWVNLITDGLPAIALSVERPEPGIMKRRPRGSSESILSGRTGWRILWQGALIGGTALLAFGLSFWSNPHDVAGARSVTFSVLVFAELLRSLSARSQRMTLARLGLWGNRPLLAAILASGLLQLVIVLCPPLQSIFQIHGYAPLEWLMIAGLASIPIAVIELVKLCRPA